MNGPKVTMNSSEGFHYEVPIINLDDAEISNIKSPISVLESEDQEEDCTIIESENLKETKKLKNLYCNESISLLEDEKDDDCTIIENETDLQKSQSQQVDSSKSCQMISNPSSDARKSHESGSQNRSEKQTTSITKENVNNAPVIFDNDSERRNVSSNKDINEVLGVATELMKELEQTTVITENVIGAPINLDDDSERENNLSIVTDTEELLKEKQSVQTGVAKENGHNVPVVLENDERGKVLKGNKEISQTSATKEKIHDAPIILDDDEIENDYSIAENNEVLKENKDISQTIVTTESNHATIILDNDEKENDSNIAINNKVLKENNRLSPAITKENIQTSTTNENILDSPIVLDDDTESNSSKYDHEAFLKENKELAQLVEKCLDMENSTGMERIINRTVIPLYRDTSESFKKSPRFERLLTKTIRTLEMEPNRKFFCLKEFCETLKHYNVWNKQKEVNENEKDKKRVQLTTLKRKLDGRFSTYKTRSSSSNSPNKKAKPDVIDLDDDDSLDETPQNNDSDVQRNENVNNTTETNKPNNVNEPNEEDKTNDHETDDDVIVIDENENHDPKENIAVTFKNTSQNKSINSVDIYNNEERDAINNTLKEANDVKKKIEVLEMKIAAYKKIIEGLELEEVDMNSCESNSAYVRCEMYKDIVVRLYKEICRLTGTEAVKQHKVRLKVVEGRHEGPMRCLEEFINNNIDQDGNPPFPDMLDVIRCVSKANDLYQLGWKKRQIEMEAQGLFVHYGRTVQKRRQKREWRDLQRYLKQELPDPADEDPTLQARLQENAKLAEKNEKDLLDRYAQMERKNTIQRIDIDVSETEDSNGGENSSELNNTVTYNNVASAETVTGNITSNNNSSCNQIANNVVFNNNPTNTNIAIQNVMLPLTMAQNPIKYLVIDENMRPIGITTKRQNSEPLGYIMQPLNVANTSTNLLRNNELINGMHSSVNSINKTNSNTNISEACKSMNKRIRPNIGYFEVTDFLQHNEVSTNSDVDNNNTPTNKDGKENNEVSSSTEVFPISYDPANIEVKIEFENETMAMDCLETGDEKSKAENAIESNENNDMNCGLANVLELSETGEETVNDTTLSNSDASTKPVNDSGLIDKENRSSTLVNGSQSIDSERTSCELVNGSQASDNVAKPCELANEPKSVENDGKSNELENNLNSVENQLKPSEVASDSQIIHASKSSDVTNDSQSIENIDKSGELVNELQSIQSTSNACDHASDGTSNNDEIVVKKEKLDIQEMFKALGDDFTVTILSIEDPFEIIEISDSSDSEDDL